MGQQYLTEYSLLLLFVSLSVVVPIGMLATAKLGTKFGVTPSRVTKIKKSAYEGGHPAFSEKPSLFSFGYFYYALLFVAFDVETISRPLISRSPPSWGEVSLTTSLNPPPDMATVEIPVILPLPSTITTGIADELP